MEVMHVYRVDVRRGERWWVLTVPEVPAAHSQARRLSDVEPTARDLISLMTEQSPDAFDLDVHVVLPADVDEHLRRSAELRQQHRMGISSGTRVQPSVPGCWAGVVTPWGDPAASAAGGARGVCLWW